MWEFVKKVNAAGTTIILTTHYLEEAENLCRNVAIINQGKIIENERMSTLLRKLNTEIFVLNLREPITAVPTFPGYKVTMADDHTLEVETSKEQNLNDVFAALSAQGIQVVSMRNKSNRLEELFLSMVERGNETAANKKAS
jgi:ABC-2 type transport system ATP-binding protein